VTFYDYPEWIQESIRKSAANMLMSLQDYCCTFHLYTLTGHNNGEKPINLKRGDHESI